MKALVVVPGLVLRDASLLAMLLRIRGKSWL
jgi:hypothetical protein